MGFARFVLFFSALAWVWGAVTFLAAPATMASFVGISLAGATADNDLRAVYGGVALGMTLFLVASLRRPDWTAPALWVVALTLGSMAGARLLSLLLVGPPEPIGFALHAAELSGCALAAIALHRLASQR